MRRPFGVDVLRCPTCDARMEIIAIIDDERVAAKILAHLWKLSLNTVGNGVE